MQQLAALAFLAVIFSGPIVFLGLVPAAIFYFDGGA